MSDTSSSIPPSHPSSTSQPDGSSFSLLSLSIAAASAAPIPVAEVSTSVGSLGSTGINDNVPGLNGTHGTPASPLSTTNGNGSKQHRRLASTGKARRRLSDARDAANRPSPVTMQTAAAALSLASLSLSSSPTVGSSGLTPSPSITGVSQILSPMSAVPAPQTGNTSMPVPLNDGSNAFTRPTTAGDVSKASVAAPIPITNGKHGKKRGMDHKCESCSKIYRHPSCLIKHRWEHTPHWREASKFVLRTSLPEDRSLWPSFLSGGSLPQPDAASSLANGAPEQSTAPVPTSPYAAHPTSSSVPATSLLTNYTRGTSAGPRLHDYAIPASAASGVITHVRPGLVGVPTGPGIVMAPTAPMPVPNNPSADSNSYRSPPAADSWGSSAAYQMSASHHSTAPSSNSFSYTASDSRSIGTGVGGWSLPRSSLRSSSQSRSRSGSASGSRSDDESIDVDVDGDLEEYGSYGSTGYGGRYGFSSRGRPKMWKEEDELSVGFSVREEDEDEEEGVVGGGAPLHKGRQAEWDGMEMEMEMD
ncbi:hypothetical protein BD779DRAFT_155683 [Infundibulicybe gibba]|nr:hypothetical protein BD779DRAFT_155683 [Infundibulicybe gibba]